MWIKVPSLSVHVCLPALRACSSFFPAKELDANTESSVGLFTKGTRETKEEIRKDVQRPKYFQALEATYYGLADKITDSRDAAFEKRNYDEMMLSQSKGMRRGSGAGPKVALFGNDGVPIPNC